ncbi:flagellar motor protein MotB [Pseudoalteromonas denitrificans]|uniref:Chemotaxis protein MotB n=1 Tax=Pseudoalteromonas denitrificans DSM 6059 TaxID=1123010 RepID=A0A1I1HFS8_9GAMM|nr:flagellar motor protein MotB [Pseudoalteromonas denitrificans]SFC23019.1 chemotaxis protein MotB [Pseudoalteromonas denitrificans DSM 6059]
MKRYRRTISGSESNNLDRWLISYADYMTLMFAFFVVLYSLAMTNENEFEILSDSLEQVFDKSANQYEQDGQGVKGEGLLTKNAVDTEFILYGNSLRDEEKGPELVDGFGDLTNLKQKLLGSPLDSLEQDLKTALFEELETGQAKLELNQDWLTIELNSGLLFGSGSAVSTQAAKQVVRRIYDILNGVDNYIRVRGYTDDQPINNEIFSSNWQLSVSRATQMLIALEKEGINPARMAIEGYGQYSPFANNSTKVGRAENRKVVIALSKFGLFSEKKLVNLEDNLSQKNKELEIKLQEVENKAIKQDDKTIKIIKLPDGGIRITTRENEQ